MEKLIKKVKTVSILLFILSVLTIAWLFIDYLALKKIWLTTGAAFNFEWLMLIFSAVPFILLVIFSIALVFLTFRLRSKIKSELKEAARQTGLTEKGKE